MVSLLPEHAVRCFQDNFNRLADSNGTLPTRRLGSLLRCGGGRIICLYSVYTSHPTVYRLIGENPTQEELQDFINMIDKDATGFIKFPDFLFMMASKV